MNVAELKKLIAELPDDMRVRVIDREDSCAAIDKSGHFIHSNGDFMIQITGSLN